MASFADNSQRWTVVIDKAVEQRLADAGYPAAKLLDADYLSELFVQSGLNLFITTMWIICKPQAERRGISILQFSRRVQDFYHPAVVALCEAISYFSPKTREQCERPSGLKWRPVE